MIETNVFTDSSGGIAENNREASKALWILPCFFVLYSLAHSIDRIFLWVGFTDLSVFTPYQLQRLLACFFAILHRNNFGDAFRMYTFNLFSSGGQHKIFWQISHVDIIPDSSSSFQDLIILRRDFWCWACNIFTCIQLVSLFELFTKCLQNRRNQFGRIRVQEQLFWFSNCLWRSPLLSARIHSILIASSERSICTQVCVRSTWLILLWISSSWVLSTNLDVHAASTDQWTAVARSIASSHDDPHEVTFISSCVDLNSCSVSPSIVSKRMDLCLEFRSTTTVHSHQ